MLNPHEWSKKIITPQIFIPWIFISRHTAAGIHGNIADNITKNILLYFRVAAADFHILQISGENIFIRFAAHVHNCILWHFVKRVVLYNPTTCHTKYFVWEKSLACEKLFWRRVYGDWQRQVRWSHLISKSDANYGESSTHQKEAWIAYMRFGKHNLQEVTTKTPNRVAQKHENYWYHYPNIHIIIFMK